MVRVAINGFGRIGRNAFRVNLERQMLDIVAINDPGDIRTMAHLLKYDSVYGECTSKIEVVFDEAMKVDGHKFKVFAKRDPRELPWKELDVDVVLECTGVFTDRDSAKKHLDAGCKRVIISAPGKNVDRTIVLGVNEAMFDREKDFVISNASCTTNCLAPIVKVLHESFGIAKGLMTTVHAYTNDQRILDLPHEDLRRARAAMLSVIPTTTGAAKTVGEVIPDLKGRLNGLAFRVPLPTVSVVDFVAVLNKSVSIETVNQALHEASQDSLQGILLMSNEPLVSCDFKKNSASAIVDSSLTMVCENNLVKVVAWYDNEWGYSCRLVELAEFVGS